MKRKMERSAAKAAYKVFSDAWRKERRYQKKVRENPGRTIAVPSGAGSAELGRRPTFRQWMAHVKTEEARRRATPEVVQDFIQDLKDLEWEEDK